MMMPNSSVLDLSSVSSLPVRCRTCGAVLGRLEPAGAKIELATDQGWTIQEGKRDCPDCHSPFHFKPPRADWPTLVERYLKGLGVSLNGEIPNGGKDGSGKQACESTLDY